MLYYTQGGDFTMGCLFHSIELLVDGIIEGWLCMIVGNFDEIDPLCPLGK